jgi:hypothetical protein
MPKKTKKTTEEIKEYQRQYYLKNKEAIAERKRKKRLERLAMMPKKEKKPKETPEERIERIRKNKREWARRERKKNKAYALRRNVGCQVCHALKRNKGSKQGRSTFEYLPYTVNQLKEHLEAQFTKEMTWENYGSYWHVDHIYPHSLLPYDSMEHPNFQKAWALSNLRPLEAIENFKKGNKIL